MLGIIKKDFIYYIGYFIITAWAPVCLTYLDGFTRGTVMMCGLLILSMPLGGVALIEILEEKSKGYVFLRSLPLTVPGIVGIKFLMLFFAVLLWFTYSIIILSFGPDWPAFMKISQAYIIGCCLIALILAGILYILIFRFGLTGPLKAVLMALPVVMMLSHTLPMLWLRDDILGADLQWLIDPSGNYYLMLGTLTGLALFGLLFILASKALCKRGAY